MGMALVFDESAELAPAPPGDYGMCGAAGEYGTISRFATQATGVDTGGVVESAPHHGGDDGMKHGSTFGVLVSFVVVLGVVAIVATAFVRFSRHKFNGMFLPINPFSRDPDEVQNPLSEHTLKGSEHQYSDYGANNKNTTQNSGSMFQIVSEDDLEEIDFGV